MTAKLDGRTALVSGSGRGIGREIALKLASEGARVVVNDLDADPAHETAEAIRKMGGQAVVCAGSVTETPADSDSTINVEGKEIRFGTPEEAAGAVYLFCTPESNHITGQLVTCGGGGVL